jgi:hypothetical protein
MASILRLMRNALRLFFLFIWFGFSRRRASVPPTVPGRIGEIKVGRPARFGAEKSPY